MEFFEKIKTKVKELFGRDLPETPNEYEMRAKRKQLLRELNEPEDGFEDDLALDEEELKKEAEKSKRRRDTRKWYYIFGMVIGLGMIVWGVVGLIITPKPDLYLLLQSDGYCETADLDAVQKRIETACGDRNGDGKVTVKVTKVYMPAIHTEQNDGAFTTAREDISQALLSGQIALIIGRAEFLEKAAEYEPLEAGAKNLSECGMAMNENSPLLEYKVAVRQGTAEDEFVRAASETCSNLFAE